MRNTGNNNEAKGTSSPGYKAGLEIGKAFPVDVLEQARQGQSPGNGHFRQAVEAVNKALSCHNALFRKQVLLAVMKDVSETTDRADRLIAMKDRIRAVVDGLDSKAKAAVSVLSEISGVSGLSVGVDYGCDIENELRGGNYVEQALNDYPDDPDVATLAEAHELASYISQSN